jgi:hypothetical protein
MDECQFRLNPDSGQEKENLLAYYRQKSLVNAAAVPVPCDLFHGADRILDTIWTRPQLSRPDDLPRL